MRYFILYCLFLINCGLTHEILADELIERDLTLLESTLEQIVNSTSYDLSDLKKIDHIKILLKDVEVRLNSNSVGYSKVVVSLHEKVVKLLGEVSINDFHIPQVNIASKVVLTPCGVDSTSANWEGMTQSKKQMSIIRCVMEENREKFSRYYTSKSKGNKSQGGSVKFYFKITPEGKVIDVSIESVSPEGFNLDFISELEAILFPSLALKNLHVKYQFTFNGT